MEQSQEIVLIKLENNVKLFFYISTLETIFFFKFIYFLNFIFLFFLIRYHGVKRVMVVYLFYDFLHVINYFKNILQMIILGEENIYVFYFTCLVILGACRYATFRDTIDTYNLINK